MSKDSVRTRRRQKVMKDRKGKGLIPDRQDVRDFQFSHVANTIKAVRGVSKIPSRVDLRHLMSPVRDQKSLGSCTAQAVAAGLMESTQIELTGKLDLPLSTLHLYYNTRLRARTVNQDSGASLRDTIKTAAVTGVCSEAEWPYVLKDWNVKPSPETYDHVDLLKINNYYRVNNLNELKEALAFSNPVVFGLMLYESFNDVSENGVVKTPDAEAENFEGGHAMCAVGYDNKMKHVIVRNSWGSSWGDNGYCYIGYDYMGDSKFCVDMWTATFSL